MARFGRGGGTGVMSEAPRITVFDDVASPDECAHVISLVEGSMRDARVVGADQADVMMAKRSASVGWLATDQTPEVAALVDRVADLAELPASRVEDMQVVRYVTGDQHTPHLDTFDPDEPGGRAQMKNGGQRLRTGLLYLAKPKLGGSTAFHEARCTVKPKVGRLVLFDTVLPGTSEPDPLAIHAGMPVVRGEKWACNFWFRERNPRTMTGTNRANRRKGAGQKRRKRR